jgi:uncharacterized protein YbjT (DUF2867 family)
MKVLVTGATGYIGGRLVPRLLEAGLEVRCMTRDPARLGLDPWRDQVEIVKADALDEEALAAALDGCDVAYYLIHGMEASEDPYPERDRRAAENFRRAAETVGLQRIVYLGGLGSDDDELSRHLRSRHEVGRIFAAGATPVTELRAAVIIGSGSVSFEMIRHLVEVLPIMMTPRWVRTRCQPIAIRNVLEILIAVLKDDDIEDKVYDIGGPDILTYQEMMQEYARIAGLRRRPVLPLPIFSTRLSPMLVGLITPLPNAMARPLIGSLLNDVVATRPAPPGFQPEDLLPYHTAVSLALEVISQAAVETRWSDALTTPAVPLPGDPVWSGAVMEADLKIVNSSASVDDVFWAVTRIGGDVGYYAMNWAWKLRGWFDQLIGGVGLRRGRRHPEELRPGESLDFFRVVDIRPEVPELLLQAEMKVPGEAWLGWKIERTGNGSRLIQRAQFVPRGLLGRLYWWALLPFHRPIFRVMARRMVRTAEQRPGIGSAA